MYKLKNVPLFPEYRFGIRPLDEYIKIHADRVPDRVLFHYYGTDITYREMDSYIDQLAAWLHSVGFQKGDTVGLFMQNCPQFTIAFFAVQRLGGIISAFSPMFKEWDLEFELNELRAKYIIANTYLYPIIKNVIPTTSLERVILTDLKYFVKSDSPVPWTFAYQEPDSLGDSDRMMETLTGVSVKPPKLERDIDDVSLIMFTSGTTGLPKGAMLTYMNALYKSVGGSQTFYFHEHQKFLQTQPMCHIAGMNFINDTFYLGATACILTAATPESICAAIERYWLDTWYTTSLLAKMVMDYPAVGKYNLHTMRSCITSGFGIPTSQELIDAWNEFIPRSVMQEAAFGLTESHTADTLVPPELVIVGGNGMSPFPEMLVKIIEDGKERAIGEVGEIVLKNKGVFKGYLNNPAATAEVLRDGWLYTGDAGKLDENGYLYFLGRRKEMIKSSGFSVFPDEVELYMGRHPAIDKVLVVGKTDAKKGEIIKAFATLKPAYKGKITAEELIEWAKDKMASYKRPRELEIREALPLNSTGKLMRRLLKEEEEKKLGQTR
ncbi:MAG: AMP-binding protein [Peptococcaceae bacterium]|jgi:long-chain acyl-CoA synthetase|nr:AMP-binding protein [Peptococcaceae bacterium]